MKQGEMISKRENKRKSRLEGANGNTSRGFSNKKYRDFLLWSTSSRLLPANVSSACELLQVKCHVAGYTSEISWMRPLQTTSRHTSTLCMFRLSRQAQRRCVCTISKHDPRLRPEGSDKPMKERSRPSGCQGYIRAPAALIRPISSAMQ